MGLPRRGATTPLGRAAFYDCAMPHRPRKPDRPLAHIAFSKSGRVRKVVERLPREKDALEMAVVRKFAGALQQRGVALTGLALANEPADVSGTLEVYTILFVGSVRCVSETAYSFAILININRFGFKRGDPLVFC